MPWIIENRLFQCRYPHFTSDIIDYQDPEKYAINVIVNLQDHGVASYRNHILDTTQVIFFPIMDYNVPDDYREFKKLIDRLVELYNEGKNILIHCQGGRGRSSIVSCCLYARIKRNSNAFEVLRRVSDKVGCMIPETREQEDYIVHYVSRRKFTTNDSCCVEISNTTAMLDVDDVRL
jgi:protein-tyrosine phosphatase